MKQWRRLGIVGAGRAAGALALPLARRSEAPVLVYDKSIPRAASLIEGLKWAERAASAAEIAEGCDVILIAVPDDVIGQVATDLAAGAKGFDSAFAFHVSGFCSTATLKPLADRGALVAGIHPVMTFTGHPEIEAERLRHARVAITAAPGAAMLMARAIVEAIGGQPFELPDAMRSLYHAALSHAANHLVTLIASAGEMLGNAGVQAPLDVIRPLVSAAVENALTSGLAALSGPLLRGDAATVAGHLRAIDEHVPDLSDEYRSMAKATLRQMDENQMGNALSRTELKRLLEE